jgi:hypothetical protein
MLLYIPNNIKFTILKNTKLCREYIIIYTRYTFIVIKISNFNYFKSINFVNINKNTYNSTQIGTLTNYIYS